MTRKKIKLAWIENTTARATSLKKRRLGLIKKVKEIIILCDVKACIIMYSPNDAEPMVWPHPEATREILHQFFALPDTVKVKKEMTMESYLKQKTAKMHEHVLKFQKKNKEYTIDLLMDQLRRTDCATDNLTLNEMYLLLYFLKENIILMRNMLSHEQFPPLPSPPRLHPFGVQYWTNPNDVPVGGHVGDQNARNDGQPAERVSLGTAIMGNQDQYVIDNWVAKAPNPSEPTTYQQIGMNQVRYNENPNVMSNFPFQGSSSSGNPNVEMEPVYPPIMTFYGLDGSIMPPLQLLGINNNPIEAMRQPMQYPSNPMSGEFGVNEEGNNINNGGASTDGVRQEPPLNGPTAGEGNVNAMPSDVNTVWPGFNNP